MQMSQEAKQNRLKQLRKQPALDQSVRQLKLTLSSSSYLSGLSPPATLAYPELWTTGQPSGVLQASKVSKH